MGCELQRAVKEKAKPSGRSKWGAGAAVNPDGKTWVERAGVPGRPAAG